MDNVGLKLGRDGLPCEACGKVYDDVDRTAARAHC